MAVFTDVTFAEAEAFLRDLGLATLQSMKPCAGGIENTNYFVSTPEGDFVLTLFERLQHHELPFYLGLMKHLADNGIPSPRPVSNPRGEILHHLRGKPAAVVNRLVGTSQPAANAAQCRSVGRMLASMHVESFDFSLRQANLRGLGWWNEASAIVMPFLSADQRALLHDELAFQNRLAVSQGYQTLPRGTVHGDLFRDNVLFDGGEVTGVLDFYFAGQDVLLLDLGVCLNDWCLNPDAATLDDERACAFIEGYETVRELKAEERHHLPYLRRAAALRFWVSRLWDFHLPRAARLLVPHDPAHFERVLRCCRDTD